jgi:hypothetical protein
VAHPADFGRGLRGRHRAPPAGAAARSLAAACCTALTMFT